ncbi:MAG: CHAT domain-containing protein [Planctomycetaceae bacterium]
MEFNIEDRSGHSDVEAATWFGVVLVPGWRAGVSVGPATSGTDTAGKPDAVQGAAERSRDLRITVTTIDTGSQEMVTKVVRSRRIQDRLSGKWLVRYNHGVIEAWHDGERLLSGDCDLGEIGLSGVEISQKHGEVQLDQMRLAARAAVPSPQFSNPQERQTLIEEWEQAVAKAGKLADENRFVEYLSLLQRQLMIEDQIFGANSFTSIKTATQVAFAMELTDRLSDAFARYDSLLKVCEEKLGDRHPQVAQVLISREICRAKLRRLDAAPDDFPRAIAVLKEVLGEEHAVTLFAADRYISWLESVGHISEAEQAALQAIALHEKAEGTDSLNVLFALRPLATIQQQMGKQRDELNTRNRIVSIQSRALGATHAETLRAKGSLALALRRSGDYGSARRMLEDNLALQLKAGAGQRSAAAETLGLLAELAREISDLDAAENFAMRAAEAAASVVPHDSVAVAEASFSLGHIFIDREKYDEAAQQFRSACDECQNGGIHERRVFANGLEYLADADFRRGRFLPAVEHLSQALQIRVELDGAECRQAALIHECLGMAKGELGDIAGAESEFASASRIYETESDMDSSGLPRVWGYLAALAERRQQWEAAIAWRQKTLEYLQKRYGTEHPQVADALAYLAITCDLRNDWDKAAELDLQSLRIRLKLYRNLISTLSETEALTFVRGLYEIRNGLIGRHRTVATLPKSELEKQLLSIPEITDEDLYSIIWATKGIATRVVASRRISPADSPAAHAAWNELIATQRELAELTLAGEFSGSGNRMARLAAITQRRELLERQLASESGRFRQDEAVDSVSVADLVAALPADVAVIDFLHSSAVARKLAGRRSVGASHYDAFVLRRPQNESSKAVTWVPLGIADPIDEAVLSWRGAAGNRGASISNDSVPSDWQSAGRTLRQLVWEKLTPHFEGIKTIIIVPDGSLSRVPWCALPGDTPGSFLIEDFAIGTVDQPQRLIALMRELPVSGGRVVIVGGLDYEKRPKPARSEIRKAGMAGDHAVSETPTDLIERGVPGHAGKRHRWAALPGTAAEAKMIARLAPKQFMVNLLNGEQAAEGHLEVLLPDSRCIHFATHGYFADPTLRSPLSEDRSAVELRLLLSEPFSHLPKLELRHPLLLSGLVLTGANVAPRRDALSGRMERDGILTGEEITQIDLSQTELVTLSACETGLGVVADGEGVIGLQRAFATAGARTVIASLWKVDDAATQTLMTEFYRNLWHSKLGRLESLRQAQLTMLHAWDTSSQRLIVKPAADRPATAPFYWAAFTLSGDWR